MPRSRWCSMSYGIGCGTPLWRSSEANPDFPTCFSRSDLLLAEQLLNNAGISEDHKLLVRTAIRGQMTFESVAQELVAQHPRIHERLVVHHPFRRPYDLKSGSRNNSWQPRSFKGGRRARVSPSTGMSWMKKEKKSGTMTGSPTTWRPTSATWRSSPTTATSTSIPSRRAPSTKSTWPAWWSMGWRWLEMESENAEQAADLIQAENEARISRQSYKGQGSGPRPPPLRGVVRSPWTRSVPSSKV